MSAADLRRVAEQLRQMDRRDLDHAARSGVDDALDPFSRDLSETAAVEMPHRGGFAELLSKAIRWRYVQQQAGHVRVAVYARSRSGFREVIRINAGVLRHPGLTRLPLSLAQRRERPWFNTAVRPGVVDRPVARLEGRLYRQVDGRVRVVVEHFDSRR